VAGPEAFVRAAEFALRSAAVPEADIAALAL